MKINKISNLQLNCTTTRELYDRLTSLALDNLYNEDYDQVIDNQLLYPVLAGPCSVLPIYYFESTASGMKQDINRKFYIVK